MCFLNIKLHMSYDYNYYDGGSTYSGISESLALAYNELVAVNVQQRDISDDRNRNAINSRALCLNSCLAISERSAVMAALVLRVGFIPVH